MGEAVGVLAALVSSALGGTAIGATRYVAGSTDPLTTAVFRFGIGLLLLLPVALLRSSRWPGRGDWLAVTGLGLLFFGLFPILLNLSLAFTTAARGALALSTLPLLTMLVGAALGIERLTRRKTAGVLIAMVGVAIALAFGLTTSPPDAVLGDLLMVAAAFCMALYNVWSRPFIERSSTITFTVTGMAAGVLCLLALSLLRGNLGEIATFSRAQWAALLYLGVFGGALNFWLWSFALERTTPTRVAVAVTVNPITASFVGAALLGEPIRWNLVVGLVAVFIGIALAVTPGARRRAEKIPPRLSLPPRRP